MGEFERFLKEVSGQQFIFAAPAPGDKNLFCEVGGQENSFRSDHFHRNPGIGTAVLLDQKNER